MRTRVCQLLLVGLVASGLLLVSCSGFRHGYTLSQFEGQVVPAREGRGADRVQTEADFDPTIRAVVRTQGTPDYIFVESRNAVKLIYVAEDRVISFQRGWGTVSSTASVEKRIPDHIADFVSPTDRQRLEQMRDRRAGVDRAGAVPVVVASDDENENSTETGVTGPKRVATPTRTSAHVRQPTSPPVTIPPPSTRAPTVPLSERTPVSAPRSSPIPESAYRQFLKEFDAGADCPRLFELRKGFRIPFQESPQEKQANAKLRSVGCSNAESTRKKQTAKDAGFTIQEYRMYRALMDTPMSISQSEACAGIARRFGVSAARVEEAAEKVMRILSVEDWFSNPQAEIRHASDWAGEEPTITEADTPAADRPSTDTGGEGPNLFKLCADVCQRMYPTDFERAQCTQACQDGLIREGYE